MSDINTNLSRSPYFDDYLESKKFYRILFKPSTAVQARELSQVQSILQKQIERFGSHVFKDGSTVHAADTKVIDEANVVRIKNAYTNNNVVDVNAIKNYSNNVIIKSQTTGLEAELLHVEEGSQAEAPATKRLYVSYKNVDTTQTRSTSGTLNVTDGSNTVTGSSTIFNSYSVGDVVSIFETPARGKVTFNAVIRSIANNTSMNLSRKVNFSNSSIADTNYVISQNISKYGIVGTSSNPEILDVISETVRNTQSNTVNTSITSNTFNTTYTVANTSLLSVLVNGSLQKLTEDYTANTTAVVTKVNLKNNDVIEINEKERTNVFSGLQCFSSAGVATSELSIVVRNEEGVVYHKGQFLNIDPGFTVVADNRSSANNKLVSVDSNESIVSFKQDGSLLDNSAGFNNEVAPGADRLKIDPTLAVSNTTNNINQSAVATILAFNETGELRIHNDDPQYSELGNVLAVRKDETSGNFTTDEFEVTTEAVASDSEKFKVVVGEGSGYINGYRLRTVGPTRINLDRAINNTSFEDIESIALVGNRIRVHGFTGNFIPNYELDFVKNTSDGAALDLYSNTSNFSSFISQSSGDVPTGSTRVGKALVKSVELVSGTPGTNSAVYDISLYDVTANTSQKLSTAKSVTMRIDSTSFQQAATGSADIVLVNGNTIIRDTNLLPFVDYGEEAIKSFTDISGTTDNSFTFRKHSNVTDVFNANGVIVVDLDDETDYSFNSSIGAYTSAEKNNLIITHTGSEVSCNALGTSTSSGTTVTTPSALSGLIHVGDVIQIDSSVKSPVVSITNSTTVEVADNIGSNSGTLKKFLPKGKVIPLDSDMVNTIQADNSLFIKIPTLDNSSWSGTSTVTSTLEFNATDVKSAKKIIRKDRYFAINTANNTSGETGPWQIGGATDVHKVTGVFIVDNGPSSVTNTTVTDLTSLRNYVNGRFFEFDSGQRDFFYDYAKLDLTRKGHNRNILNANSTLIVRYDNFEVDTSEGTGYFNIDSYPVSTNNTANSSTILLEEVPIYVSQSGTKYDLRNVIDHRPVKVNTTYSTLSDALTNADTITTRTNTNSNGFPVYFKNDSEFVTDYTKYNSKRVDVYLDQNGDISTSTSEDKLILAPKIDNAMKIASLGVEPYPSLTEKETFDLENTINGGKLGGTTTEFESESKSIDVDTFNIRGYTMKDIGALHQRIDNLEYYASMNSLENEMFNKQFKNDSGLERFKNGIFVDPLISHQFGQTDNSDYSATIDPIESVMRPTTDAELIQEFEPVITSGDLVRKSNMLLFDYTERDLIKQDKATKVRPAAPVGMRFTGELYLFPEYDVGVARDGGDIRRPRRNRPARERIRTRGNRRNGRADIFGNWRPLRPGTRGDGPRPIRRIRPGGVRNMGPDNIGGLREFVGGSSRPGIRPTPGGVQGGNREFMSGLSISPFIRVMAIGFKVFGLRPNTIHSFFFNGENVDDNIINAVPARVRPLSEVMRAPAGTVVNLDDFDTSRPALDVLTPIGRRGDPIVTDDLGTASGIFVVPANRFLQGEREVRIVDVDDLDTEGDAIFSEASANFYSNRLEAQFTTLPPPPRPPAPPRPPRRNFRRGGGGGKRRRDPIAQTFTVPNDFNTPAVFVSSLDIFFRTRGNNPIRVFLCEVENGYPNTQNILQGSVKRLKTDDVNVSQDGSVATTFTFRHPIKLLTDRQYAFVVKPDLDDPDYDVYFSEIGGTDLITGSAVNFQPFTGIAFLGANESTWSPLQSEDIKFTLKRANFSTGTGRTRFIPEGRDFIADYEDISYLNNHTSILEGDFVYGTTNAESDPTVTVSNVNTSIVGVVSEIDDIDNTLTIIPSSGNWATSSAKVFSTTLRNGTTRNTTKYKLAFYRPVDGRTEVDSLDQNRFVGSTFGTVEDHEFSVIVPQFTTEVFNTSTIDFNFRYNVSNTEFKSFGVPSDGEYEYTIKPLIYRSKSNEINTVASAQGNTSFVYNVKMTNTSEITSPIIDLRRATTDLVGNLTTTPDTSNSNFIDGTSVDNELNSNIYSELFQGAGESNIRYISRVVELAEGQDAEDLKVFVTAYKPARGRIDIFVRACHRFENIEDQLYTPMRVVNGEEFSARDNILDTVEYEYRLMTTTERSSDEYSSIISDTSASNYAYTWTKDFFPESILATNSEGIAEYKSRNGSTYDTFLKYQIKIVVYDTVNTSTGYGTKRSSNPPLVHDVRAVALQV